MTALLVVLRLLFSVLLVVLLVFLLLAAAAVVLADAGVTASAAVASASVTVAAMVVVTMVQLPPGATWLLVDTATRKLLRERFLVFERLRAALFTRPKAIEPSSVLLFSAT